MIPCLMIKNIGEKPDLVDSVVLLDFWQYECNILSFGRYVKIRFGNLNSALGPRV